MRFPRPRRRRSRRTPPTTRSSPGRRACACLAFVAALAASALPSVGRAAIVSRGDAAEGPSKIQWHRAYDSALAEAKRRQRPLLVDFYTDWCGWCRQLDRTTFQDDSVAALAKGLVCLKVNAEKFPELAQQYGVAGFPTLIVLDPSGTRLDRIAGYLPADAFRTRVQAVLASAKKHGDLQKRFATDARRADVARAYARSCLARGDAAPAQAALDALFVSSEVSPEDARHFAHLAFLYGSRGEYEPCERSARVVLTRFPGSPHEADARFVLGACAADRGNAAAAKPHLDWVLANTNDPQLAARSKGILLALP